MTSPRRRRWFVVAAVLAPFLVLALIEGALRLGGYSRPMRPAPLRFLNPEGRFAEQTDSPIVPDPVLLWRLRVGWTSPNGQIHVAPSGYRTDFRVAQAPGARRVVCVGDSSTFGLGVAAESAWPARLGRALAPTDEVLNLGVPGYTSWQARRLLETEVAALSPDVVAVEVGGFNDWIPAVGRTDREQAPTWWEDVRVLQAATSLVRRDAKPTIDDATQVETMSTRDFTGPRRVPLVEFEDDLRAIVAWTKARGARAVLLVHALPKDTVARNPIADEYAAAIVRVAGETSSGLVDERRAFAASGAPESELFIDFCHPTERGHELVAEAVKEALERR